MFLKKFFYSENIIFFFITILSIFFSISYSFEQIAIEAGLVISEIVKFPKDYSIMQVFYKNSWSILNQITALFLKFELSNLLISRILLFISTFLYFLGIFFIIKSLTKTLYLSFFLSFFILFFRKYLGHLDYPTMIFHELTWGMMSASFFVFIAGLLFIGQLFLAGFFTAILISVHILVGLWIFFIVSVSLVIYNLFFKAFKKVLNFKNLINGFLVGLIPTFASFMYYFENRSLVAEFNIDLYKIYLSTWDWHLNVPGGIVISYSIISFLLLVIIYFLKKNKLFLELQFAFLFIFLSILCSGILYSLYKLVPNIFPISLLKAMPSRYFILHSIITYPILICFCYILFKNYFIKKKYNINILTSILFFLIFYYSSAHYKYILLRLGSFKNNLQNNIVIDDKIFWDKVKNEKINGFVLTSQDTNEPTLRIAHKPILIRTTSMDVMRMLPYTTLRFKEIVEEVYGLSFVSPPKKHLASIPDIYIKEIFEKRNKNEWTKIAEKFNISSIIVPVDWKLNLELKFYNNKFSYYIL